LDGLKTPSNKVIQLYWVIIFIPPIYTQTIVKWVARIDGERITTQTPTLPFTRNPFPKKPKNLKPNTLFFFFSKNSGINHGQPAREKKNPGINPGQPAGKGRKKKKKKKKTLVLPAASAGSGKEVTRFYRF
jgi:hypothetical protein